MKVLLVSPLPKIDPACGDVTYTEALLAEPPEGVTYETYAGAIARGVLREHGDGKALKRAFRARQDVGRAIWLTAANKGLNALRKRRMLFWEPFRFFTVQPGEYDLIHIHVFSASLMEVDCPVVVSNAAPLRFLYTKARGMTERRANRIERAERLAANVLGVDHTSYCIRRASRVIAFTHFLADWYRSHKIVSTERVDIVPIWQPARTRPSARTRLPRTIGFVAKDFSAKGGEVLLRTFQRIRSERSDVVLRIAGCERPAGDSPPGVEWLGYVDRKRLLEEVLPTFDVFAYPTQFDGQPLVVLEALARGIPVATSDYQAVPELVDYGRAGLVSKVGDVEGLAANLLRLLDPRECERVGLAGYEHFSATYSATAVRPQLRAAYDHAIGDWKRQRV